jgi:hypothetical protein
MKSQSCVNVLAILNAMIAQVSSSLPQIDDATRSLFPEQVPAGAGAGVVNGSGSAEE